MDFVPKTKLAGTCSGGGVASVDAFQAHLHSSGLVARAGSCPCAGGDASRQLRGIGLVACNGFVAGGDAHAQLRGIGVLACLGRGPRAGDGVLARL